MALTWQNVLVPVLANIYILQSLAARVVRILFQALGQLLERLELFVVQIIVTVRLSSRLERFEVVEKIFEHRLQSDFTHRSGRPVSVDYVSIEITEWTGRTILKLYVHHARPDTLG